jgi:carboxyl-terminal processing protease
MAELPNVSIAGMMGTNGSFGTISDGFVLMPENFLVIFPRIACVEEDGRVMIDTDASGIGGVKPDIKIPIGEDAVHALFDEKKDYELDYVLSWLDGTAE